MLDRFRGCLLGLACGDALGGPVEFVSSAEIRALHPGGLRDFVGGGWLRLEPGEITDDTQMTLALARSLARGGPLDMEDVGRQFVAWFESKPKDIGNTTRAAIANLVAGVPWEEAGQRVHDQSSGRAAGNGSVMRCAPVALRFATDPKAMVQASIDTARITHADPRCTWAAVAVNQAIVSLLAGATVAESTESATIGITNDETRLAVERAAGLAAEHVPSGGYVLDSVTAAFWALANHDSLEETIIAAVGLGRDTDTTGAVAGAMAGAHYGAAGLPDRWLRKSQNRDEIESLADRLFDLAHVNS